MDLPTIPCSSSEYLQGVLDIYESSIFKRLDKVRLKLTSGFESYFKDLGSQDTSASVSTYRDLFYSNSAYSGHYFSFFTRTKTVASLREKLIRNDDILSLQAKYPILNDSKKDIENFLYSQPDLIGIKIIGELEIDVDNIISVIATNKNLLEEKLKIEFLSHNLKNKTLMENGLEIYKVKCNHSISRREKINFELQVKSKFMSAWGDMEHQMFYKDRLSYAVKDYNQDVMNKVGAMIGSLDDLLYSIRNSKKNYHEHKSLQRFVELLQDNFGQYIKEKFTMDTEISLIPVATVLLELPLFEKDEHRIQISSQSSRVDSILSTNIDEDLDTVSMFQKSRDLSFKIMVIEYIYTEHYLYNKEIQQDQEVTRQEILDDFISNYKQVLMNRLGFSEIQTKIVDFNDILDNIFSKVVSQKVWLLDPIYYQVGLFYSLCLKKGDDVFTHSTYSDISLGLDPELLPDFLRDSHLEESEDESNQNEDFLQEKINETIKLATLFIFDNSISFEPFISNCEQENFEGLKECIDFVTSVKDEYLLKNDIEEIIKEFGFDDWESTEKFLFSNLELFIEKLNSLGREQK